MVRNATVVDPDRAQTHQGGVVVGHIGILSVRRQRIQMGWSDAFAPPSTPSRAASAYSMSAFVLQCSLGRRSMLITHRIISLGRLGLPKLLASSWLRNRMRVL